MEVLIDEEKKSVAGLKRVADVGNAADVRSGARGYGGYHATALYTLLRGEPSDSSTNNTLLPAGQYRVNTYNDSYYRMNVSGVDYYIKISDVQTLGTVPDSGSSGSTGGGTTSGDGTTSTGTPSLITGEKDATYANEILNFTVPAAGLFLYREASSTASPAASIAAGTR